MSYSLHFVREQPISLDEWKRAIGSVPGLRLDESPTTIVNPHTGDRLTVPGCEGDVALTCGNESFKVFRFSEGYCSFNAPYPASAFNQAVAQAAMELAAVLQTKIVGSEGEVYEDVARMTS